MHKHRVAEGIVDRHPLLSGFERFLRKEKLEKHWIQFLTSRVHFAYPKTLWIKIFAEAPSDVKLRHTLDPQRIGSALSRWIQQKCEFRKNRF